MYITRKRISLIFVLLIYLSSCSDDYTLPDYIPQPVRENPLLIDGPYIMDSLSLSVSYTSDSYGKIHASLLSTGDDIQVISPFMNPESFHFNIMDEFPESTGISGSNDQILAISDIEGNYYAFTQLLIGNGVVDDSLNWIFGSNRLVLVGDMVDRGSYVTQVLWLIYKLDKEAEEAGGKVHFILGNHDIMCMIGDDRYADRKYLKIADELDVEYKELYGTSSEIGRWLRTKNAIEKVGNFLFVHGGVSPEILNLGLSIEEMNDLIRPYYGKAISLPVSDPVYKLYKTSGLFWYRGYVKAKDGVYGKATQEDIDAILSYFDVESIIVGHCVVDEIKSHFDNGVFTIDVLHPPDQFSDRKLQALLIENNNIYRVDGHGTLYQLQ